MLSVDHATSPIPCRVSDWLAVIRSDFNERPALRVNLAQAHERWPIAPSLLAAILDALADARFLRRLHDDSYVRHPQWSDI